MSLVTVVCLLVPIVAILACMDWGAPMITPCGSRLLWVRFSWPTTDEVLQVSTQGNAKHALMRCMKTIGMTLGLMETQKLPLDVIDMLAAVPYPGTWETCKSLLHAFPVQSHSSYLAMWLPGGKEEDSTAPPHTICDADLMMKSV